MNSTSLRWGIIGTGNIAHTFAKALQVAKKGDLVAVGSRSSKTAENFGAEFGISPELCFSSYEELLSSDKIDIVYISTPHPLHYDLALLTTQHGKHMLIEKPMAMTATQVKKILETAKEKNLFVMEAYMYRCHPQTLKLVDMIRQGDIGKVKLIRANFSFDGRSLGSTSRLWRNELGGGAILDIGGCKLVLIGVDEMIF
jgi:predicted dehydrogenase